MGYGPETIHYGAGWAQIDGTLTPGSLFDKRLSEGPYYGDREDDFEWVGFGMDWYDLVYPDDPYVVNMNPAKVFWESSDSIKKLLKSSFQPV